MSDRDVMEMAAGANFSRGLLLRIFREEWLADAQQYGCNNVEQRDRNEKPASPTCFFPNQRPSDDKASVAESFSEGNAGLRGDFAGDDGIYRILFRAWNALKLMI